MSKVIYCYDREEIKDIIKEAIVEYNNEAEERLKMNFVEEIFRLKGYEEAKQIASNLGVRIPYWMEARK